MYFDILHDLPGRMRVHCRVRHFNPEYLVELERWVSEHGGVLSASFSRRTGNLLIIYSRAIARESLLAMLGDMHLLGITAVLRQGVEKPHVAANPVLQSCGGKIAAIAVKRVLPTPLVRLFAIWRMGRGGIGIVQAFFQGDTVELLWRTGLFAIMTLCKTTVPVQLFLTALDIAKTYIASTINTKALSNRIETENRSRALLPAQIIGGVAI